MDPSYDSKYQDIHGRMIAAVHDRSIESATIWRWESEALDLIDAAFRSPGPKFYRNPDITHLEHRTNIKFCATNALGVRRSGGAGDGAISREEQVRRLEELKRDYLKIRETNPGVFGDMYVEELQFIEHELRSRPSTSFNPIGCALLLAIAIVIVVFIVK